ncbi:zf-HC2 domain-containing protein [Massilia niastensis]|uniref:zf-HC2 domain-containing protein n=1 Tax=Massilia niastensis TaxID=544911 RepID=UPI000363F360|nr:zf-HC2 domain-containing protein [Massilia niastensis]
MSPHAGMAGQDAHRAAQEALPWLLNGTLASAERDLVERHLQDCAQCRADLDLLRGMRAAASRPEPECDPERALARLLPALDPPAAALAPAPVTLLRRWRRRLAANDGHWLRWVATAQFGVIALLAGLLLAPAPVDKDAYRALGAGAASLPDLVLVFRPDTPERELRRIVRASGVRIVDGPTTTDAYLATVPGGALAPALARLRAEPAVVLAEPLAGGKQP